MQTLRTVVALGALVLAVPVLADPPVDRIRYDFLDLGVLVGETDSNVDFSAIGIAGSWGFHDNFALIAGLGAGEIDTAVSVDTTDAFIGLNPHFALTPKIDLVIPFKFLFSDVDGGFLSDDDTGYSIGFGIRALPNPAWEFNVGLEHEDIFGGDEQSLIGGVRWHTNHLFSLGFDLSVSDDAGSGLFTARFSF